MCLPGKTDQPSSASAAKGAGSILGIGAGGVIFALALCAAVPGVALAWRRRAARRQPTPER
jgi:hypothetical protein